MEQKPDGGKCWACELVRQLDERYVRRQEEGDQVPVLKRFWDRHVELDNRVYALEKLREEAEKRGHPCNFHLHSESPKLCLLKPYKRCPFTGLRDGRPSAGKE